MSLINCLTKSNLDEEEIAILDTHIQNFRDEGKSKVVAEKLAVTARLEEINQDLQDVQAAIDDAPKKSSTEMISEILGRDITKTKPSTKKEKLLERKERLTQRRIARTKRGRTRGAGAGGFNRDVDRISHQIKLVDQELKELEAAEVSGPDRRAKPHKETIERRVDTAKRKKVSQMSMEERAKELLTSEKAPLSNERAYNEADRKKHQSFMDLDNFKDLNEDFTYEGADQLIGAAGEIMKAEAEKHGVLAYHLHGDEFIHESDNPQALEAFSKAVQDRSSKVTVTVEMPDGSILTKQGLELSYGIGKDQKSAETALKSDKQKRLEAGIRTERERDDGAVAKPVAEGKPDKERKVNKKKKYALGKSAKPTKTTVTEYGKTFKTGQPVTFSFLHNKESATGIFGIPEKDAPFGRGSEPSGRYVISVSKPKIPDHGDFDTGKLTFNNPLVIENDSLTWKKKLSDQYDGKTGKELSQALIADGYDGVVTVDNNHTSEILDLTTFDAEKARYSLGKTNTKAFKKWFGDSKVVDENGEPLVVYHGTGKTFKGFEPRIARSMWFAKDAGYAGKYKSVSPGAENQIIPVYLKITNPFVVDMKGQENIPKNLGGVFGYASTIEDVAGVAQQQGYDGVIFTNRKKTVEGFSSDEYAVFRPEQIKSTMNRGTFDPADPDISASLGKTNKAFNKKRPEVTKGIKAIIRKMAPNVNVEVVDQLFAEGGAVKLSGAKTTARQPVAGVFDPAENLIQVSLGLGDTQNTAQHEALHALKEMGLITGREWRVLSNRAESQWKKDYDVTDTEEAIAYAFGDYRTGKSFTGPIDKLFQRIKTFFERLGNLLRGMGFKTVEDVFGGIESGEVGRRQGKPDGAIDGKASLGGNKVIIYAGTGGDLASEIVPYGSSRYSDGSLLYNNRFGGVFGSFDEQIAKGYGEVQKIESDNHINHADFRYEVFLGENAEKLQKIFFDFFPDRTGDITEEEKTELLDYVMEDKNIHDDPPNMGMDRISDLLGLSSEDLGEMSWDFQGIKGELARRGGYTSIGMPDEHGESVLALPGSKLLNPTKNLGDDIKASLAKLINTPSFKKWFGDSKVVDENGEPLVVYHGSADSRGIWAEGFTTALERLHREGYGHKDYDDPGRRFYFAKDRRVAASYADDTRAFDYQNAEAETLSTYLSLQNPIEIDWSGKEWIEVTPLVEQARKDGHDGAIILNVRDTYPGGGQPTTVYVAFNPNQIKSTMNRGTFDPADPDISASLGRSKRKDEYSLGDRAKENKSVIGAVKDAVKVMRGKDVDGKPVTSEVAKVVSLWDKTVGTRDYMVEKILKSKKVSDKNKRLVRSFSRDTELMENDKAEILKTANDAIVAFGTLATIKSKITGGQSPMQNNVGDALFEGTLQNSVFADSILREQFGLDKDAINVYHAIRMYYDASTQEHKERLLERIGLEIDSDGTLSHLEFNEQKIKDAILYFGTFVDNETDATKKDTIKKQLETLKAKLTNADKRLKLGRRLNDDFNALSGYFPLLRYGRHSVSVYDGRNNLVYFALEESKIKQAAHAAKVRRKYGEDHTVSIGLIEKFVGDNLTMDPRMMSILKERAAEAGDAGVNLVDEIEQKMLKSFADQSFRKRFIHRKGIPGYDKNIGRSIANYGWSSSNYLSKLRYIPRLAKANEALSKHEMPEVREQFSRDIQYLKNPGNEFAAIKAFTFAMMMGLNVKSAVVNLTQIPMTLYPYLADRYGDVKATAVIGKSMTVANPFTKNTGNKELNALLDWAEAEGITMDQYLSELWGEARGGRIAKARRQSRLIEAFTYLFSEAERWNRRTSVAAVYYLNKNRSLNKMNKELEAVGWDAMPTKDAALKELAKLTVDRTQFNYGKFNRGRFFRKVGGIPMQFKQFEVNYLQFLRRHMKDNPGTTIRSLAVLFLMVGVMGLPGADDLKEFIEYILGKLTGKHYDLELEGRKGLVKMAQDDMGDKEAKRLAQFILRGHGAYSPWDISGSVSAGNPIPGFKTFFENAESEGPREGIRRGLERAIGAGPSIVIRMAKGLEEYSISGDLARLPEAVIPVTSIRNALKAVRIKVQGVDRNYAGKITIAYDPSTIDIIGQALSFQPSERTRLYKIKNEEYREAAFLKMAHQKLLVPLAAAEADDDKKAIREAEDAIDEWNKGSPEEWELLPEKVNRSLASRRRSSRLGPKTGYGSKVKQLQKKYDKNREYYQK